MKDKSIFVCESCGQEYLKWQGRCDNCGGWNSLKELRLPAKTGQKFLPLSAAKPLKLAQIKGEKTTKLKTGIEEWDRVLGEGMVKGSMILLGGDPGIGKSTLVMEVAERVGESLYISGEESLSQLKLRAQRLKIKNKITFLQETNVDAILQVLEGQLPHLLVIDSIQTLYDEAYPSTAGSIIQVRQTALKLQNYCKSQNLTALLVGHVTKEGELAGPRTLEHLVDVLLYLEGDKLAGTRLLRSVKNRFGKTEEVGIFQMGEKGMQEIKNPSEIFLEKHGQGVSGTIITSTLQGNRPLLVEIQALTSPTLFGYPRRLSSGFDLNRLQLILAVLQKRAGLNLASQDVYINVVGGLKITEPALDLPVALSIVSAYKDKPLEKLVAFGELGLSGELREVSFKEKRIKEAHRLGFKNILTVSNINEALKKVLESGKDKI